MLYTARIEATQGGSKFIADKNGNFPFLAIDLQTGRIHPFGGIINGTVGRRLGIKSGDIVTLNVSASRNDAGQTNYQHSVMSFLTETVSQELAKAVVAQMLGNQMPVATVPATTTNSVVEETVVEETAEAAVTDDTF